MKKLVMVSAIAIALGGCSTFSGTTKIETVDPKSAEVPTWYLNPGADSEDTVYSASTAVSDNLEFAVSKASHQARIVLAEKIASTASETLKQYNSDNAKGGTSTSRQMTEQVTKSEFSNVNVSGYRLIEKKIYRDGDMYRAYVLMSLSRTPTQTAVPVELSQTEADRAVTALDSVQ